MRGGVLRLLYQSGEIPLIISEQSYERMDTHSAKEDEESER
jgi:hypothetical protein